MEEFEEDDYNTKMSKLRANIDIADSKILEILGNRMKVAEQIGTLKKEKKKNVFIIFRLNPRFNFLYFIIFL